MSGACWSGRIDGDAPNVRRWHQAVRFPPETGTFVIQGYAVDVGIVRNQGRPGAAEGPASFRRMLSSLPYLLGGAAVDVGDVLCEGERLEEAHSTLQAAVENAVRAGNCPVVVGGGHDLAYPLIMGAFLGCPAPAPSRPPRLSIINFDAHFDLRCDAKSTSGTPFKEAADALRAKGAVFDYTCIGVSRWANTPALFETAHTLGVTTIMDDDCSVANVDMFNKIQALVREACSRSDAVVLSVCLDVFPACVAPGVSAPAAKGVSLEFVEPLLDIITRSGKVVSFGIAELSPKYDVDNRTARVAARLAARVMEGVERARDEQLCALEWWTGKCSMEE